MARNTRIYRLSNFTGGENYLFPSINMPPKYSLRLQNCHISDRGGIAKIPGFVKVNTTSVEKKLSSGFEYTKNDGSSKLLCAGAGDVYKVDTGDELTSIKSGLDTTAKVYFSQMSNVCVMSNGVDAPWKYDGTTVSALAGTPVGTKFKKCHAHKGRMWAIDSVDKMTAFHSALNAIEDWTTASNAGYIDFRFVLPRGDELIDICTFVDLIVFFFRQHIVIYAGTNPTAGGDFRLVQLIEGSGAINSSASIAIGTDMYFLYDSGIKSLRQVVSTGNLSVGDLSQPVTPLIKGEAVPSGAGIFGVAHYPKASWSCFLIGGRIFLYSYLWKAWGHLITPIPVEDVEDRSIYGMFTTPQGEMYLCGDGYLYKYGVGYGFDDIPMTMQWDTGWINFSKGPNKTYPKIADVVCYPGKVGTVRVDARYDFSAGMMENFTSFDTHQGASLMDVPVADVWDASFYLDNSQYPQIRFPLFGGGRSMQLTFTNTSTDGPFEINDITIQAVEGGM